MRTKLLFFFFLLMLLQVNMSTSAMVLKDAHRIMLKDIKASGSHRSMPVLPTAFIDGSLLSVDFLSAVTSAAVTVRNSATGEIVYSSVEWSQYPKHAMIFMIRLLGNFGQMEVHIPLLPPVWKAILVVTCGESFG